ncbi:MAG: hypothetical protein A3D74_01495 [Candidatus Levybacteria bacterium RIFCSPHIGHO2_02_FULL_37_13]|nr:MAG: hypothetical protein A3D74_01495 [Candidatus Levybacteria bacterium RIFCSPHIGHO2_02_FULL_37_13]OGH39535.1 MAG: hypothetical protein A3B41_00175 [Candidatus Levybacteria bacterium RIFCSPLOWO2_01_FULL_37_26]
MNKTVLHIDFDSFFASVEQQHDPLLRGKPLGVTAANGRTCIIASSREAKKIGIKTGARTYEAIKVCPALKLVKADFVRYFEVSKKFLNICKDYSPYVEMFSIDELFMDITLTEHLFGGVYNIVKTIKKRIKEEIGEYITASVGISYNKLLAKLASGMRKPDGVFEIKKNDVERVYKEAKLTDICGIGERIRLRLNKIGIYSLLGLRDVSLDRLIREFGNVEGHFLKSIGLGIDENRVVPYTIAPVVKSVGRNYCLPKNEYDKRVVLQNLFELCEEVGIKLRRLGKKARTVGMLFRGSIDIHGRQTYGMYVDKGSEIFNACLVILRANPAERDESRSNNETMQQLNNKEYVRQISVWVSNLENKENVQQSLFDSAKQNSLQETIDAINDRFGDHTIRNGFLLYADKLTTVPNGYMADRFERLKIATEFT